MATREILVFFACFALVCSSETEDSEQKKRGAGKTTALNAIPTGAQKPDYTYTLYSQSPSSSNPSTQTYQSQVPNSFYPSHGASQYFVSHPQAENIATHTPQPVNFASPQPSTQFVPLNFIPNPGYQAKYHLTPPKSNGNIQLAIIQPPSSFPSSPFLQYPQTLFSPTPTNQVSAHPNPLINSVSPHGHFNFPQNYQPISLGNPYLSHQPAMVVVPQPNPSLYNSLVYPNLGQSFYNYYPSNSQTKYYYGSTPASPSEYEKGQSSVAQSVQKESSDLSVPNAEYITPADASGNYKSAYSGSRGSSYTKLT